MALKNTLTEYYEELLQGLQPHHNLEAIHIESYQDLNLYGMHSLKYLDDERIGSFPEGFLQNNNALENLQIDSLAITTLSNVLDNLSALKALRLYDCNHLEFLPEDSRTSNCKKLTPLSGPMNQTTALRDLYLTMLPELKDLPESMQLFSALQDLHICGCEGLCSLPDWLGSLESLSSLFILNCKNLSSLSDGFKTPESLTRLEINGCPELEKRCKKPW
ncbi:UNVERIFIED_CONTAM: hypothetical protein Scaly_2931800 [Sesamum calycinum]|uniref:Disease resistance protein At4g27190-like leucine-rich repeats domain-containing protein n=1 Tax=Sesamum calycinum TaxID=2727403 RepID=A0AAW2KWT9_9LAMI